MGAKILLSLIFCFCAGISTSRAEPLVSHKRTRAIPVGMLKFYLERFDDGAETLCSHEYISEIAYNLQVTCRDPLNGQKRLFTVHLVITEYDSPTHLPAKKIEVLNWVSESLNGGKDSFHGASTSWYNLKQISALTNFEISQSIEKYGNDRIRTQVFF